MIDHTTPTSEITDTRIWIDQQGHEWTLAEWAEHAASMADLDGRPAPITWHVRLDDHAVIEGDPWGDGPVLLEPRAADTFQAEADAVTGRIQVHHDGEDIDFHVDAGNVLRDTLMQVGDASETDTGEEWFAREVEPALRDAGWTVVGTVDHDAAVGRDAIGARFTVTTAPKGS